MDEVIQRLRNTFIGAGEISDEELRRAAIEGIIDSLDDPYTSYLSPEQYRRFIDSMEAGDSEFEGIGAEVTARGGEIMILWPLAGSPARRAGVQAGDLITKLNDETIKSFSDLTRAMVAKKVGQKVKIAVLRGEEKLSLEVTLGKRSQIQPRQVLPVPFPAP